MSRPFQFHPCRVLLIGAPLSSRGTKLSTALSAKAGLMAKRRALRRSTIGAVLAAGAGSLRMRWKNNMAGQALRPRGNDPWGR
jgi:hypothetical protein